MRTARTMLMLSLTVATPFALQAQSSNTCPVAPATPTEIASADICAKGSDIFTYMLPQLGNGLAGGNTTPGQGGSLGGFPHFVIAVRATGAPDAKLPDFATVPIGLTGRNSDNIATKSQVFGLAGVDAAVGIWGGYSVVGIGSFGGVDALVSAVYVPDANIGSPGVPGYFSVKTKSPISIGYGVRVGLFNGAALLPSVGVSYLMRSLPTTTLTTAAGTPGTPSTITITDLDLKTTSWRVTASQSLIVLTLNAGYGEDTYDGSTGFSGVVNPGGFSTGNMTTKAKMTRTNWFGGATVNLIIFKVFAEYGQATGGSLATFNKFGGTTTSVNDSKSYFSAGLRFGI